MQEVFEKIIEKLEEEREYAYANFDDYVEECSPCLDAEYGDLFHRGLERAVKVIKEIVKEYNNGWIPISSGRLPKECEDVEVTVEEINEVGEKQYYNVRSWLQDGRWVIKKNPYNPTVIAWRYPTQPYVPKGE